uniref:Uncharacterized protein n=1 Tax=Stomoxys calcitrans TaxID=35570 RepID=A0A1I8P4Z9_STOCA
TLQLLHVLFRHGPRTPADTYPNDPHVNQTYFPYGWGHITNSGKRELFNIGTWMRKRYGKFLGDMYFPNLLHAQSTGVVRTHMSMQTVLASFFPPKNSPMEWNSKYNWQPIPVFSQELNEDTFLLVRKPCPRYFEAFNEVMNTPEIKEEIKPHEYLFPELTALTGMNITEPEDINSLYLTLLAEEEYGLQLPDWTKEYYPEKLQFLAEQALIYNIYTREMQKIKAGPFLTKMFTEMKNKASNTLAPKERKMYIYTGHDSTEIKEEIKPHEYLFPELTALTGMNITEPEDINSLYLTLLAEEEYGLQLPDWTKEYYPEKLQFLAEQALIYNIYTREMQKIKAGPFLTKMFTEMKNKASNTLAPKERKMYIYTGHDS